MHVVAAVAAALVFAMASVGIFWLRRRLENPATRPSNRVLVVGAILCLVLFIAINVSDWPGTVLAQFWATHAIFAATASTLPLLGIGYFAFQAHDVRLQGDLDQKVAATGRGGVVDHLVDIDVALALLSWDASRVKRRWTDYDPTCRPLRWLRQDREKLGRDAELQIKGEDPRAGLQLACIPAEEFGRNLVDQSVRRIMVGIKEWGPILSRSRDGQRDLVQLGSVRLALLALTPRSATEFDRNAVLAVQQQCRQLAWKLELTSGTDIDPRPELLMV